MAVSASRGHLERGMVLNLSDLDKSIVLQVPAEDTKLIDLLGEGNKNSELGQMFRVPRGLSHGIAGIEPGAIFVAIATIILLRSAAIFALSYLSSRRFKVYVQSTGSSLPNALPKPFLSNLRHKLILVNNKGGDLLDVVFADKYRKYGPTHALYDEFGVPKVIHTIDPANLTAVLVTREKDWASPKNRTNTLYPLAQEGLLTTSGERWHRNRKMIHRQIGSKRAKDVRSSEGDIQLLFQAIGPADKDSWTETVDLYELYHRCALDMSTKYLMGESSQSQAAGIKNKAKEQAKLECGLVEPRSFWKELSYDEAFETVRGYLALRSKLGSKYWLADGFQYRRACSRLDSFADDLIEKAIQRRAHISNDDIEAADGTFALVDNLVRELRDPVRIRNLVMDLFVAGQNMTGTMAAWVFAQLEAHPDMFQRVRAEVLEMFGTEQDPRSPMTWENLKACRTLQNVMFETLRCYPLLANIGRNAACDTVLPRGGGPDGSLPIAVPKGTTMALNVYLMHRREEEWSADSSEWKPDRWIGRKFGPEYAPFGAGPRICVGQALSMTETSYLTARMMQRFDLIQAPEGQDNLTKGYKIVVAPKYGVKVRLRAVR